MTTYLLDANVLIALVVDPHEHHELVVGWTQSLAAEDRLAICPVTEGALVRFLVRVGAPGLVAAQMLAGVRSAPRAEWWPDSVSYRDLDLTRIRGHRQVTDAYLVGLADDRAGGVLVTLDQALAQTWPQAVLIR